MRHYLSKRKENVDFDKPIDYSLKNEVNLACHLNEEEILILDYDVYEGPVTMQLLPYGGIQTLFHYNIVVYTANGFMNIKTLMYKDKIYPSKEFILTYGADNLVNHVLTKIED